MQQLSAGQPSCLVWFIAELADDHLAHDWEKVLYYCQQSVFCACGLLLQVTKGPAILGLDAQHAQLRERSSADPALGPRYSWEGCVVFDVVCRDIAFPTYLMSWWGQHSWHFTAAFHILFSVLHTEFSSYVVCYFLYRHISVFHCVTLRWTGSSCSFNK